MTLPSGLRFEPDFRLANGSAQATRRIEGQKMMMARTKHSVTYDDVHDEIIVPNAFSHAILTFPGGASGELSPIRVMQGPLTGLVMPDHLAVDPVHNEIFVPVRTGQGSWIYVFPRDAVGNVAPIRKLGGPNTGISSGRVAVDPVRDLLFVTGNGGLKIFNRASVVQAFVGAWRMEDDNGDVPPRWTIAHDILKEVRGVASDPQDQGLIVSDKSLNAIMTYHFPEVFK